MTGANTAVVAINNYAGGGLGGYDTAPVAGVAQSGGAATSTAHIVSGDQSGAAVVAEGGAGGYGDGVG